VIPAAGLAVVAKNTPCPYLDSDPGYPACRHLNSLLLLRKNNATESHSYFRTVHLCTTENNDMYERQKKLFHYNFDLLLVRYDLCKYIPYLMYDVTTN
jgi:hypothetical protein